MAVFASAVCHAILVVALFSSHAAARFDTCFTDTATSLAPTNAFNFSGVDLFGLELFQRLASANSNDNSNLLVSPYSIWSALSIALMGSEGSTKDQLLSGLGLPSTKLAAYTTKNVLDFLLSVVGSGVGGGPDMLRVDRAYFDQSLALRSCVQNALHNVEVLDFSDSAAAAERINNAVSIGTGGQITNFLSPTALLNTVFVLINAIYFRGTWETEFDPILTNQQVFYNSEGQQVATVDMMSQQSSFKIVNSPALGATMLELPYSNSNISMLVLLPDIQNPSVDRVLEALTPYTLFQAMQASQRLPVNVLFPKFDLSTEVQSELVQALTGMGITDMFIPGRANFSAFATTSPPLYADTVIHQAKVNVDESGTVAAAATAIIGTRSGPGRMFQFIANRPFIFLIFEKRVRVTLFAGVVKNPSE